MKENKVTAILLVAGNSTRFGQNRNKNFEMIQGKSILSYSLKVFGQNQQVDEIMIAAKEDEIQKVQTIIEEEKIEKPVKIILGGKTRKESVYHCIKAATSEIVIIHDGARPVIKQCYIDQCLENMEQFEGVTIGVKSKDTIKITDENNIVINTTQRSNTWLIQTPQCFNREVLLAMHEKYQKEEVTDDCMLLEMNHKPVKILEGDYTNIKVTMYEDLKIVEGFLTSEKQN